MKPALARVCDRIARSADIEERGVDVEPMLDEAACAAFVALYPDEVPDFRDLYARRRFMRDPQDVIPEHVVDAIVLAVAEGDDGRGLVEALEDERTVG